MKTILSLALVALLSACGGGSGSDDQQTGSQITPFSGAMTITPAERTCVGTTCGEIVPFPGAFTIQPAADAPKTIQPVNCGADGKACI